MDYSDAQIDRLTEKIIGCGIEVHKELGPGLLESVYRECFCIELATARLNFTSEQRIPLIYKRRAIKGRLQLDVVVEGIVIIELKSVEAIHPVHLAQGVTYLKLANCPAGLIMNFNVTSLRNGIRRLSHPDRHRRKSL